jgi:hypothetical protein
MAQNEAHISDQELLLSADREAGRKAYRIRAHLEVCPRCCARAVELESMLEELARAERNSLKSNLPSISVPRAMLRLRLAELSSTPSGIFSRLRLSAGLLAGVIALVCLTALAGFMAFRNSGTTNPSAPLQASDRGILPNRTFTPGVVRRASLAEVCALPHEQVVRAVSPSQRQRVLEEYGIPAEQSDDYELDYLITPGLGGEDDIRNLWPQPHRAATWNAFAKDVLEERLHEMVCAHQLDLAIAQEAIADNWIAAYKKYVQAVPPNTQAFRASSLSRAEASSVPIRFCGAIGFKE